MRFFAVVIMLFSINAYCYSSIKEVQESKITYNVGAGIKNKDFKLITGLKSELIWNYDNALNLTTGFNANFSNFKIRGEFDYALIKRGLKEDRDLANYNIIGNSSQFDYADKVRGYDYTLKLISHFPFFTINENNVNVNFGISYNKMNFKAFDGYVISYNIDKDQGSFFAVPKGFQSQSLSLKSINAIIGLSVSNETTDLYINTFIKLNSQICPYKWPAYPEVKCILPIRPKIQNSLNFEIGFKTKIYLSKFIKPILYATYNFEKSSAMAENKKQNLPERVSYKSNFTRFGILFEI
jgi:hypothetical protein